VEAGLAVHQLSLTPKTVNSPAPTTPGKPWRKLLCQQICARQLCSLNKKRRSISRAIRPPAPTHRSIPGRRAAGSSLPLAGSHDFQLFDGSPRSGHLPSRKLCRSSPVNRTGSARGTPSGRSAHSVRTEAAVARFQHGGVGPLSRASPGDFASPRGNTPGIERGTTRGGWRGAHGQIDDHNGSMPGVQDRSTRRHRIAVGSRSAWKLIQARRGTVPPPPHRISAQQAGGANFLPGQGRK